MSEKHGWGHSLISQVRQLAVDAQVKNLAMFHHDPERTDSALDEIALESANYFKSSGSKIGSYIAAEGLTFELKVKNDPKVSTLNLLEY
jgi:ribonuclease BN (tRNA processing enzyme)